MSHFLIVHRTRHNQNPHHFKMNFITNNMTHRRSHHDFPRNLACDLKRTTFGRISIQSLFQIRKSHQCCSLLIIRRMMCVRAAAAYITRLKRRLENGISSKWRKKNRIWTWIHTSSCTRSVQFVKPKTCVQKKKNCFFFIFFEKVLTHHILLLITGFYICLCDCDCAVCHLDKSL